MISEFIRAGVDTSFGRIRYLEKGDGPTAVFLHGALHNGLLWKHQLRHLSDYRRIVAIDLLAHGDTEANPGQDLSVTGNAMMLGEFLQALGLDQVDLVGNGGGGAVAQIFSAMFPTRVRSLILIDCDTHDGWPGEAYKPFIAMTAAGGLRATLASMLSDKNVYRSPSGFGLAYEHPEKVTDDEIDSYLRPLMASDQRVSDLERFVLAADNRHTVAIEPMLRVLKVPTLILWGTDDPYFPLKWSHWLSETIPSTKERVDFEGARLFFPVERWENFNRELRTFWKQVDRGL